MNPSFRSPGWPQSIGPAADPVEVDAAAGGRVQRPVVGALVDAPQLGVGQVGQLGPVVEAEQPQQPEHHVRVYVDTVKSLGKITRESMLKLPGRESLDGQLLTNGR